MLRIVIVFFRKVFRNILSVLKKKTSITDRFNKSFSFSIHSPLFKKADKVLASKGSSKQCCFRREFFWIIFYTCNSKISRIVWFGRKLVLPAIKLEFARFLQTNLLYATPVTTFSEWLRKRWAIIETKLKKSNIYLRRNSFP